MVGALAVIVRSVGLAGNLLVGSGWRIIWRLYTNTVVGGWVMMLKKGWYGGA